MRTSTKIVLVAIATSLLATLGLRAATTYQIDNNTPNSPVNASDGTEPLDNWFANEFTITAGGTTINSVIFGYFTTTPSSVASVLLYNVTGAGGNPALGASRVYTQAFTPLVGDGTNAFLQTINLTTPVGFNVGDKLLVAILIRDVIANQPNDVYPYIIDTGTSSAGSYWDRSTPNTFNPDNISAAVLLTSPLTPGGFVPGPGNLIIRATGVPEPSTIGLGVLGAALSMLFLRRKK